MKLFVDTSGWAAAFVARESFHTLAAPLLQQALNASNVITTNHVVAELSALLTRPLRVAKSDQIALLQDLRNSASVEIVHFDAALEAAGWQLWESRADKDWSFVDCCSFLVMQNLGVTDALTSDHHFEQAGFIRLLR
jgi:predicted nucleic acid-binding protein